MYCATCGNQGQKTKLGLRAGPVCHGTGCSWKGERDPSHKPPNYEFGQVVRHKKWGEVVVIDQVAGGGALFVAVQGEMRFAFEVELGSG